MNPIEFKINELTIAGNTWGNPNNPPILALHGWLDNANSFNSLASHLESSYFFIAVDLPGHGHSSHLPLISNYHFTDGIFTVVQIMNALKLEKVHLLGHSMGACLASLVAGVAPHRFHSLGLIEGLGPFSHPADTACKQLSDYLNDLIKTSLKPPKGYEHFETAVKARSHRGYVSMEIAKQLCERGVKKDKGLYFWQHDRRLLVPSPLRMTETQVLSCLKNIAVKTCLIWASKGFSFNSEMIQERIKAVKSIEIIQLDGGHHIHMEQPESVGKILNQFFGN